MTAFTMCSAFTPDYAYDNSVFKLLGTCFVGLHSVWVYFVSTKRLSNISADANIFVFVHLNVSSAQYSISGTNIFVFFEVWPSDLYFSFFEATQLSIQDNIGAVFRPGRYCSRRKCVYVHTWKENDENCYECLQYKSVMRHCEHSSNWPKTKTFVGRRRWHWLLCQKNESWLRKLKTNSIFGEHSQPNIIKHARTWAIKSRKSIYLVPNRVDYPLVDTVNQTIFPFGTHALSVYSNALWLSQSPTTVFSGLSTLDKIPLLWLQIDLFLKLTKNSEKI